jgi:methanogenic corrinoid protein MtbC1
METRSSQVAAVTARTARYCSTGKDELRMTAAELLKQYLEHLFGGKRCQARELIFAAQDRGVSSRKLLQKTIWPAMEQVEKLYRENQIPGIVAHMATRINRMLADQLQGFLARKPKSGRRMVVACGDGETEELGAQITADLFEADGWSVWFLGSGVPNDEILQFIGNVTPDILLLYGTQPAGVPGVRKLINLIREIGICQEMQVLVMGGVFNRAEGLGDEVKADLFAANAGDALRTVEEHPVRIPKPDVPEPGRRRKRKRKMKVRPMRRARAMVRA